MSSKNISLTFKDGGILTDVSSMKFSDPTGTYGLRRTDTAAVVIADGTDFFHDGTGLYSYTVAGLAGGVTYDYWIERTYNGVTKWFQRTFIAGSDAAAGYYANEQNVLDLLGTDNLQIISQLDPDSTDTDHARIQRGLDYADAFMDAELSASGLYATPLANMGDGTALLAADCAARLCVWWLDQNRWIVAANGSRKDIKEVAAVIKAHREMADAFLEDVKTRKKKLFADLLVQPTGGLAVIQHTPRLIVTTPIGVICP